MFKQKIRNLSEENLEMARGEIGFVGLGIMGKPMVRNLMKADYSVTVYDIVA